MILKLFLFTLLFIAVEILEIQNLGNAATLAPSSSTSNESSTSSSNTSTITSTLAPGSSAIENNSTTPTPGNVTTENPQNANNSEHLDSLPILTHSNNDSQLSALVRRHGDIKGAQEIHKETANMKKVKTVVGSTESFDESACHINQRGPLYRLYGNSKFFADSDNLYDYAQAKEICEENGLDLAEVEDMEDHRSVQNFVKNCK